MAEPLFGSELLETAVYCFAAALEGAEVDLKMLARCFTADDCKVELTSQREVARAAFYQLSSSSLELATQHERQLATDGDATVEIEVDVTFDKAREIAEHILRVMDGAARLVRSEYKSVKIAAINKFSLDGRWLATEGRHESGDRWRDYPLPAEQSGLTELTRLWAQRGLQDEPVARALTLYGTLPLSWAMLYMVYEIIRDDAKASSFKISDFLSKRWESDFTSAANNARLLRDGPRHAKSTPVGEESLITLEEGHSVIRHLFNHWLGAKVQHG